ncbi:hypothetical protein BVRB_016620, partial [Beta vulgaris subsp. vulgaris]
INPTPPIVGQKLVNPNSLNPSSLSRVFYSQNPNPKTQFSLLVFSSEPKLVGASTRLAAASQRRYYSRFLSLLYFVVVVIDALRRLLRRSCVSPCSHLSPLFVSCYRGAARVTPRCCCCCLRLAGAAVVACGWSVLLLFDIQSSGFEVEQNQGVIVA